MVSHFGMLLVDVGLVTERERYEASFPRVLACKAFVVTALISLSRLRTNSAWPQERCSGAYASEGLDPWGQQLCGATSGCYLSDRPRQTRGLQLLLLQKYDLRAYSQ